MKRAIAVFVLIGLAACAKKSATTTSSNANDVKSSTSTGGRAQSKEVAMIDKNTYLLVESSADDSYGYKETNPVKVGGAKEQSGPLNERRFLNGLAGPNGETIRYFRAGSCCPFKTPNGLMGNSGMLDRYRVFWEGGKDTVDIFINMYDKGKLLIPKGFTAKKP